MHDHPLCPSRRGLDWARAQAFARKEQAAYFFRNPHSQTLARRAAQHLLFGVPLHWMNDWGTPFVLQVVQAQGAHLVDADGHTLADFAWAIPAPCWSLARACRPRGDAPSHAGLDRHASRRGRCRGRRVA
jgi:glutamate-1-semialdehyde 2,1-aminomutase